MREIKFRVFHKKRKKLYEVHHLHCGSIGIDDGDWATCKARNCIENQDIYIHVQPEDCILMQYTGVDTEGGSEIYEGDICDPEGIIGQYLIEWNDHYGRVMARGISYILGGNLEVSSMVKSEIVGTVYQNPELLKDPK